MPSLNETDLNALFTMMKGEPGTRKSTCALSYPTPQYWISTDQKMEALRLPAKRWGIPFKDIQFDDYKDWNSVESKLSRLQIECPFKTIIVDSITSMGDAMTSQVKKAKKKDKEGGGKTIGGIPVSGLEEFNAESSAFQDMIAMLKDIHKYHKVHIILIAHVIGSRKDNEANKSTHHSRIIITGAEKISGKLASYVTEAYHFNIKARFQAEEEGEYGLLTVHTGNDYARTSLPLPREIMFNDKPLYREWIEPAIKKQMENPPQTIPNTPNTKTTTTPNTNSFVK
jgi:hypothetical protein